MLKQTLTGARSLLTGMKVTFKNAFKKPVTSQYPRERIEMSQAYRNVIVLVEKEDVGSHDCIDCGMCERVCPSFCIKVEGERPGLRSTLRSVQSVVCVWTSVPPTPSATVENLIRQGMAATTSSTIS